MKAVNMETICAEHNTTSNWINSILSQMRLWRHNYRTRRQLAELPPHLLKDLGLEPDQVATEVHKPFWR